MQFNPRYQSVARTDGTPMMGIWQVKPPADLLARQLCWEQEGKGDLESSQAQSPAMLVHPAKRPNAVVPEPYQHSEVE